MTALLGKQKSQSSQTTQYSTLQVQTSAYGNVVPMLYGINRIAPNLIWYGNFKATPQSSGGSAGKGGGTGSGGGKNGGGSSSYTYQAAVMLGLCEGPINGFGAVYIDKNTTSLATLGFAGFLGAYPQAPWGFLESQTQTVTETHTVPASSPYQVTAGGASNFAYDEGVTGIVSSTTVALKYLGPTSAFPTPSPNGYTVDVGPPGSAVYHFSTYNAGQSVILRYKDGRGNVQSVTTQIPTSSAPKVQLSNVNIYIAEDVTVIQAVSAVFTAVSSPPGPQQYQLSGGIYLFNAAQAGQQVTLRYVTSASVIASQALSYNGIAYVANGAYDLGNNAQLPNHNFEIAGFYAGSAPNNLDADPSLVVADMLTSPHYGAGFPSAKLGDLTTYRNYCLANGLWISPAYTQQQDSATMLQDIATATNSAFVWSQGALTLVPYGDQAVSGNGYSFTPSTSPLFNLTDDDFLPNTGSGGSGANDDPVLLSRAQVSDIYNSMQLECLDRTNKYNTAIVEAKDQAMIETFGLRQASSTQAHVFCDVNAARVSVQLQLQRQAVRNMYSFTLDQRYVVLDPMDIVTLTDPALGLYNQAVRITEISEQNDGTLNFTAEEYLPGAASAAVYGFSRANGYSGAYNAPAGSVSQAVIFEPTAFLTEALEVWLGAAGATAWGGCQVWLSYDGESYKLLGEIQSPARIGTLASALPSIPAAATGQTIDTVNGVSVSLQQTSNNQLLSASQADATALATLCYVDGELIAYQNAQLTGQGSYTLSYLARGAYGSPISAHVPGGAFLRLDDAVFKFGYTSDYVGKTISIKLVSFNPYGGGQQALADVPAISYQLQGTAYSSPLPNVANLRSTYLANLTQLTWDEVSDFRPVQYEIRKGTNWGGGVTLGRVAHPPFTVPGNDTYWVAAYSQPLPGFSVYSTTPQPIIISGAQITSNVIATYDEAATGWSGAVTGNAVVAASQVVCSGSGNILGVADYLHDSSILAASGQGNGTYTPPSAHTISIGRVAPCSILLRWLAYGQHLTDNILVVGDYLNSADVLDYGASSNISVYPEIAVSQDGTTWGAWQRYTPGTYLGFAFKTRMQLSTYDPQIIAYLSQYSFSVDVPDRDDHYVNLAISAGGTTVSFTPDGTGTPVAFNGGPQGSAMLPAVQVTILNASSGDTVVLSSLSLSSVTVKILNGGTGVARNVNILAEGY